jgi:hypothetical protein
MKFVLPALVRELKYDEFEISDGAMTSTAFLNMWNMEDLEEIELIRKALLLYCELDTLGMVRILGKLRKLNNS